MTDEEWLKCSEPKTLLASLLLDKRASKRKLRLFAVACCRRIWPLLPDARSRRAVDISEQFACGYASRAELAQARKLALELVRDSGSTPAEFATASLARPVIVADWIAYLVQEAATQLKPTKPLSESVIIREKRAQAALVRDIWCLRQIDKADPVWLTWNNRTVPKLAEVIYDKYRFADLPILADALEEAGCDNADILAHCRSGAEHVRGCWVVDLILEKQ
jgi:hypothetical protein